MGIDAVTIPSLAVMDDETLFETARIALTRRTTIVLSWSLWSILPRRLEVLARAHAAATTSGVRPQ